jgi:hypothetical protein
MSDLEIYNDAQGSGEWLSRRMGIPTCSCFKDILAKGEGKTRRSYMYRLAAEIITGEPVETFKSAAMERGNEMEKEARDLYSFVQDVSPEIVGFVRRGNVGGSPDSFIGDNGILEIKTQRSDLLAATILEDKVPPEHVAQIQGYLWITGRKWCDLWIYWPRMPHFLKRVPRDDAYIAVLEAAVETFNAELQDVVARLRARA